MNRPPSKLKDFLESFVDEHALEDGGDLLLDVTAEEAQDLGLFFIRGICGWMHGLDHVRRLEGQPKHRQDQPTKPGEQIVDEADEEISDETDEDHSLVN